MTGSCSSLSSIESLTSFIKRTFCVDSHPGANWYYIPSFLNSDGITLLETILCQPVEQLLLINPSHFCTAVFILLRYNIFCLINKSSFTSHDVGTHCLPGWRGGWVEGLCYILLYIFLIIYLLPHKLISLPLSLSIFCQL